MDWIRGLWSPVTVLKPETLWALVALEWMYIYIYIYIAAVLDYSNARAVQIYSMGEKLTSMYSVTCLKARG